MAWTLLDSGVARFADGNGGHAYSYPGGAPDSGDLLVVGVNSNTVVSTPSGWTLAVSAVTNQGAYVFTRLAGAGESSSVTVTTSGDHNTALSYRRYSGGASATPEQTAAAQVNGSTGVSSPAVSPAALSGSGRLCLLYSMNHGASSGPLDPVPSAGYSMAADTLVQGSGGTAAEHLVLQRLDGSGSETPSVSWTDNGSNAFPNRYALFAAFTPSGGASVSGSASAALGGLSAAASGTVTVAATGAVALGGLSASTAGTVTVAGSASATLGGLAAAGTGTRGVTAAAAATLGALAAAAAGARSVAGQAAAQLGALTASGTGVRATSGTAAATLGGVTATVSTLRASAAATLGGLAAAAAGTVTALIRPTSELVAVAWIKAVTGQTTVATDVPADNSTWSASGFVQVQVVGGTPDNYVPIARPVLSVDCWATTPGSGKPPWFRANARAEAIRAAVLDHPSVPYTTTTLPAAYRQARVLSALMLTEPRRMLSDDAAYAHYQFDLRLDWVEVIT